MQAFTPTGDTITISATSTNSNAALNGIGEQVVIQNAGSDIAFVKLVTSAAGAANASADMPVFNGASIQLTRSPSHTHIAVICASTQTATVYVTTGQGD